MAFNPNLTKNIGFISDHVGPIRKLIGRLRLEYRVKAVQAIKSVNRFTPDN